MNTTFNYSTNTTFTVGMPSKTHTDVKTQEDKNTQSKTTKSLGANHVHVEPTTHTTSVGIYSLDIKFVVICESQYTIIIDVGILTFINYHIDLLYRLIIHKFFIYF